MSGHEIAGRGASGGHELTPSGRAPDLGCARLLAHNLSEFLRHDAGPRATAAASPGLVRELVRLQADLNRWIAEASQGYDCPGPRLYEPPAEAA